MFESRPDGGLRAWSDDVPGLVLSHTDIDGVLADICPAMETILSARLKAEIEVEPLRNIREILENGGIVEPRSFMPTQKEYVAYCH
ncbi:hypothetical protein GTW51_13835 [Aurantimonas aggregata]|uniref:DUF1902 domain-containing protein n=1 Tax=Aurantimonas aggregata TaxID=2047720 RepID=A0A6L9MJH9_9HYPH|nr:hypothetical protein [Aurantimonas aggregata]NDV87782.1 hypothetical protein [Aurantimonas aggregata]